MGFAVSIGALAQCPFGVAPTPLVFLPLSLIGPSGPLGSCNDCIPFLNIMPFGVCSSLANPITASQTAAALGVLTPGACIPVPTGTWTPNKPSVIMPTGPLLTSDSTLNCAYGGVIKIINPMQFIVAT